jgi:hypothetical protein
LREAKKVLEKNRLFALLFKNIIAYLFLTALFSTPCIFYFPPSPPEEAASKNTPCTIFPRKALITPPSGDLMGAPLNKVGMQPLENAGGATASLERGY